MGTPRNHDRATFGPKVTQLAAALGRQLMPWQRHILNVGLEVADGRFAYKRVIVHVQRRAGKTDMVFAKQAHRARTRPAQGIWYGAQKRKDGLDIWDQKVNELLLPHKDLLAFKLRQSIGSERMAYGNGSRVSLFTPAETSLVGLDTDDVTMDEARFHSLARGLGLEAGIRPTQATRDGQLWITSSAGTFGESDWLWRWIERGRASLDLQDVDDDDIKPSQIAYFDYSIPDDADPLDLDTVCAYHPAEGYTITRDFLAGELDDMDPNDFAREYAGRWTRSLVEVIAASDWVACASTERQEPAVGDLALTFGTTPDRSLSSINVGWRDADGTPHTAVADQRPGADWVLDRFLELDAKWQPRVRAYNAVGPAVSIADTLARAGCDLTPCNFGDYVIACGSIFEQIQARKLRHNNQPDLNDAVAAVAKRYLGDRWVWGHRASSGPIVAFEGATVAGWAYDHAPAARRKSVVITAK